MLFLCLIKLFIKKMIKFPFEEKKGYYLEFIQNTLESIKTNILALLLTKKYQRVMRPELYCSLYEKVFEELDNITIDELRDDLKYDIERHIPIVTVTHIDIIPKEEENLLSLFVTIQYVLKDTDVRDDVNIEIQNILSDE